MVDTKRTGVPCYDKAGDDEPLFVIRAQDKSASGTIRHWLYLNPNLPADKREKALEAANAMEKWPGRRAAD